MDESIEPHRKEVKRDSTNVTDESTTTASPALPQSDDSSRKADLGILEPRSPGRFARPPLQRIRSSPARAFGATESPSPPSKNNKFKFTYDRNLAESLLEGSAKVKNLKQELALLRHEQENRKHGYLLIDDIPIHTHKMLESKFIFTGQMLGTGSFGAVAKCRNRLDGAIYAVKQVEIVEAFDTKGCPSRGLLRSIQEVKTLAQLDHPNIVRSKDCWLESDGETLNLFIQMECCETSLRDVLADSSLLRCANPDGSFSCLRELEWFEQIASALAYLHEKDLMHYDLKPGNCVIDSYGKIKLCDFGLARSVGASTESFLSEDDGTPLYRSPEQEDGSKQCGSPVDVFSLGLIALELFEPNISLVEKKEERVCLFSDIRAGHFPEEALFHKMKEALPSFLPFVMAMTAFSPDQRPSAATAYDTAVRMIGQLARDSQINGGTKSILCELEGNAPAMEVLVRSMQTLLDVVPPGTTAPKVDWGFGDKEMELLYGEASLDQHSLITIAETLATDPGIKYVLYDGTMYKDPSEEEQAPAPTSTSNVQGDDKHQRTAWDL